MTKAKRKSRMQRYVGENRATFLARIEPIFAPSIVARLRLAYILAKYAHRAQKRKEQGPDGQPLRYFEHPRRLALIILDELEIPDPTVIIVALLHDVWEDSEEFTLGMIEEYFGAEVATMVARCSKRPRVGFIERLRRYATWQVLVVKLADRLDNLRSLADADVAFQRKQVVETEAEYFALADWLVAIAPRQYRAAAERIRKKIRSRVHSRRRILDRART